VIGLLLLIVVGGLFLWWMIGRTQLREVENVEVNIRERFAFLLTDKMREWDAAGSPAQICVHRGTRWVLERAPTAAPALGEMVAKAAYIPILRDKIGARFGYERSRRLLDELGVFELESRHSGLVTKWWDNVDYTFDRLLEAEADGPEEAPSPRPVLIESDGGPLVWDAFLRRSDRTLVGRFAKRWDLFGAEVTTKLGGDLKDAIQDTVLVWLDDLYSEVGREALLKGWLDEAASVGVTVNADVMPNADHDSVPIRIVWRDEDPCNLKSIAPPNSTSSRGSPGSSPETTPGNAVPKEPALRAKGDGCAECGSLNRDGARFCDKCGSALV
jgi:hypothetical protein